MDKLHFEGLKEYLKELYKRRNNFIMHINDGESDQDRLLKNLKITEETIKEWESKISEDELEAFYTEIIINKLINKG